MGFTPQTYELSKLFVESAGLRRKLITRVLGRCRFDQHDPTFFFSDGVVSNTARHGEEIAFAQIDGLLFQLDAHAALYDVEQLVFGIVRVPYQMAFEFRHLKQLIVNAADHFRRPVVGDTVEGLQQVLGLEHGGCLLGNVLADISYVIYRAALVFELLFADLYAYQGKA